jgi:hypothetical protein
MTVNLVATLCLTDWFEYQLHQYPVQLKYISHGHYYKLFWDIYMMNFNST